MFSRIFCAASGLFLVLNPGVLPAEDQPEPPRIALAAPFAIPANATTKVIVRGWKLNRDIEAKSTVNDVSLKILKHDNAPIPGGQDAKQIGDSLVELEVTLPPNFTGSTVLITLTAGGAESLPYALLIGGKHPVVAETEPNDGFRQAQSLAVPGIVDGQIHADRNVDVYAIDVATKQTLVIEVLARRQGSNLDSLLTLLDAKGRVITINDDTDGADSRIEKTLDAGRYFLVVQDAHDHGGPAHPYRLSIGP